ncbi:thiamine pyrophosphate-binding protein [Marinomonas piezotolerans]|uniref:Thiamine pyrophosphate-binding protein n=1 Tax=Marinomonas piezotolerans TaxID=2213058 RepID=A0A370UCD9_9GAMM|nr:thiamine pyrophosphate-binding protein [Marinomonas piezotolerans]RDL45467.1 thiamine pyrophosphate-binding protein [Marinomonas piezotolerans]
MSNVKQKITGADALVMMLDKMGVKHIFGVCGDTSLPFYDSLTKLEHGITHILTRDERSAAYMADVYARLTNRVGVVEGPSGAGATYMVPGIAEANGTTIPVLAITSDIPVAGRDRFVLTECDQEALFKTFTKYTRVTETPEVVPTAVRAAFNAMTSGVPGAAHLGLPYDVLKGELDPEEVWGDGSFGHFPCRRTLPASEDLQAAAKLLLESEKIAIICGGGVMHSNAVEELQAVAETLGAAIGTTISAKGTITETHPLAMGTIGTNGSTAGARDVLREADTLVYVGCRVGSVTSEKRTNPHNGEKKILHIDIDPKSIGANYLTDVSLVGDAKATLAQLLPLLATTESKSRLTEWGPKAVAASKVQKKERFDRYSQSNEQPIYGERFVTELQKSLPDDAIVVSDPGTPTPFLCAFFETQSSGRSFIFHRFHGGLGFALPGVVGAHFANTGRKVVGVMGDGSFGFSSGELETIVRYNLPVTLIVLNNSSFGWIRAGQDRSFGKRYFSTEFSTTDHAKVAEAYGLKSWKVEDPNELAATLKEAFETDGPTLVDVYTRRLEDSEVPVTAFLG